ncbi:hypothetical protein AQUCO_01200092v1 [Aquilegia coerulea]|uniref:Uncharacterized protein n=1 Tax=Aquilegia coerulea TaxID=218851 RepID=A0A2G5E4K3_AQUCA|nr:hypothetical protein AQUCO_01200092v1 [Aquilegia coerulea]
MKDFEAPSFSLVFSSQSNEIQQQQDDDDDDETLISNLQVEDTPSPPVSKTLKNRICRPILSSRKVIKPSSILFQNLINHKEKHIQEFQLNPNLCTAPSFSLGLDLDEPAPPNQESHSKQCLEQPPIEVIRVEEDDDQSFRQQTLIPDLQVDDPPSPPVFKRLKRGLSTPSSRVVKRDSVLVEDEIEDISSPEDTHKDEHAKLQKHSSCKRSKIAANGFIPLSKQFSSKLKARQHTQASNASTVTSMEASSSKTMFPKLTISPLRKFLLIDSDTDDSSSSEDIFEDAKKVDVSASKRPRNTNKNLTINQQKGKNVTGDSKLQTEDLWKDFGLQKGVNIQTPALDEFCQEFFTSAKGKTTEQDKDRNVHVTSSKMCDQKKCISENAELYKSLDHPLPPAYKYFYHDDPRIQRLVRHRLPNFFPLGVNTENPQSQAAEIDYMFQFSQREPTSRNQSLVENSRMGRKNSRQPHHKDLTEASESWVNPKGRTNAKKNADKSQGRAAGCSSLGPKNAGKRRVRAEGGSSGSWFTGEDGRKVYVTKTGQEMTGQIAYRHYRKVRKT